MLNMKHNEIHYIFFNYDILASFPPKHAMNLDEKAWFVSIPKEPHDYCDE